MYSVESFEYNRLIVEETSESAGHTSPAILIFHIKERYFNVVATLIIISIPVNQAILSDIYS
jgi:hypothetical protein